MITAPRSVLVFHCAPIPTHTQAETQKVRAEHQAAAKEKRTQIAFTAGSAASSSSNATTSRTKAREKDREGGSRFQPYAGGRREKSRWG